MVDLRERLEGVLRDQPRTPADAERAARAAEALAAYLRLEESVSSLFEDPEATVRSAGRKDGLDGMTLHEAAEQVLEEAGIPLHVTELGKRIKAGGWRHKRSTRARPEQINYQLAARLPRYPDVFIRVSPNTFALVQWDRATRGRPKPRVGVYRGGGGAVGRSIGERPEKAARSDPWRSS